MDKPAISPTAISPAIDSQIDRPIDPVIHDLAAEYAALTELCGTLNTDQWRLRTAFYDWTPWDEIAHLLYFDEAALVAINDPARFAREAGELVKQMQRGESISALARKAYDDLDGPALLARWQAGCKTLIQQLQLLDSKARLPWYGPAMSARSFATARLMETWAHGQDIWDVLQRRRPASTRLKHIAHLGVSTFAWSFKNRGLPVPDINPAIVLSAPDGTTWLWGEANSPHRLTGSAEEFCLLVTQRRHVDDTSLQYTPGPVADWLKIAQCFAGPPAEGPAPGLRKVQYLA